MDRDDDHTVGVSYDVISRMDDERSLLLRRRELHGHSLGRTTGQTRLAYRDLCHLKDRSGHTGNPSSRCSRMSRKLPSITTPRAPKYLDLVLIRPPQHAVYPQRTVWGSARSCPQRPPSVPVPSESFSDGTEHDSGRDPRFSCSLLVAPARTSSARAAENVGVFRAAEVRIPDLVNGGAIGRATTTLDRIYSDLCRHSTVRLYKVSWYVTIPDSSGTEPSDYPEPSVTCYVIVTASQTRSQLLDSTPDAATVPHILAQQFMAATTLSQA
ncbi:hypothetical protein KCU88_g175, partial [Aureobasidium melanogenum]